ncbi:transposase [Patescibacteria group bacterium]|nr:transposase [Patescibacteria group bacterium]
MILNKYGKIVNRQINWVKNHFGDLRLGKYGVMPNHVHLILEIDNPDGRDNPRIVPTGSNENYVYSRRHNTLSKIINALKTTSSKSIHLEGLKSFKWQRSFYDHIIRNEKELEKIRELG